MKRVGHLFEKICRFENLYLAFKKAFLGSGLNSEASRFSFHLERELLQLKRELESGVYQPGRYRYFTIHDPKERTISVAPFRDRVVHHALVGVLEPVIEPRFIFDTYANRKGKGTHRAVRRAQYFLRKHPHYLKTDIAKYFESIDHQILLSVLNRTVKDFKVLDLVRRITANSDRSRGLRMGKGLPIGNLTSQFFANLYLDPLDHFIKDELGVRAYVRYMDDLVFFSESRNELKRLLADVRAFLEKRLKLRFKPSATVLNSRVHGLPFLGFRVFPRIIRIRRQSLERLSKKMKRRSSEYRHGEIEEHQLGNSLRSMFEHLAFADSLGLRRSMLGSRAGAV